MKTPPKAHTRFPQRSRASIHPWSPLLLLALGLSFGTPLSGHPIPQESLRSLITPTAALPSATPPLLFSQNTPVTPPAKTGSSSAPKNALNPAEVFELFSPKVRVRKDGDFLTIESNGLPAHQMMVGITAWQQQVPLPQAYTGANAWRIPLKPIPAKQPQSIHNHFLRGAIALAANGIPIFNPQNNRGEISQEIGELDQWGGHCGLADDYHYHAAPLHLQSVLGKARPIAYALDGFPIYGLTEPDGQAPTGLDAFNGHNSPEGGYHYHASLKYPYINGGFYGEVVELNNQVDPQPRAQPIRPGQPPLRGAQVTNFTASPDEKTFTLRYTTNAKPALVRYGATPDGGWKFEFTGADGTVHEETYRAGEQPGGGGGRRNRGASDEKNRPPDTNRPPPDNNRPPQGDRGPKRNDASGPTDSSANFTPKRTGAFVLSSPEVAEMGPLPVEYTGDGAGISPPLEWKGAPAETKTFAVIMHHLDPEGKTKWYWTLYNIPADTRALPKNTQGLGSSGSNSVNDRIGYAPPHSKGPGSKTYILTVYALSAPLNLPRNPAQVNRETLLTAMKEMILDSAELKVVYTRPAGATSPTAPPARPTDGRPGPGAQK